MTIYKPDHGMPVVFLSALPSAKKDAIGNAFHYNAISDFVWRDSVAYHTRLRYFIEPVHTTHGPEAFFIGRAIASAHDVLSHARIIRVMEMPIAWLEEGRVSYDEPVWSVDKAITDFYLKHKHDTFDK